MASTDKSPGPTPAKGPERTPGEPMTARQHVIDKGAQLVQSLKPIKQMSQHACSFAIYSHDMSRQIETHHYCHRLNEDFLQCPVYDSDEKDAHLLGVEYIISHKLFETLPPEEQKLWHSHSYEIKSGMWVHPRVPEMVGMPELESLAKTYGKFWCTWQVDRGDRLPLGAPALMMSPQAVIPGLVRPELVHKRDVKYSITTEDIRKSRVEIAEPEWINPLADYWKQHGKGFVIDIENTEMKAYEKKTTPKWRYDLGRRKNFEQVFGMDKRYWFIPAYSDEDIRRMPALQGLEYPSKPEFDSQEF